MPPKKNQPNQQTKKAKSLTRVRCRFDDLAEFLPEKHLRSQEEFTIVKKKQAIKLVSNAPEISRQVFG